MVKREISYNEVQRTFEIINNRIVYRKLKRIIYLDYETNVIPTAFIYQERELKIGGKK